MKNQLSYWSVVALAVSVLACEREPSKNPEATTPETVARENSPDPQLQTPPPARDREAEAKFIAVAGLKLHGDAELEETAEGVEIEIEVDDGPVGMKGLHIHEKGDCSDIAGKSMGTHFAPDHKDHGLPDAQAKHLGDLGNITIDSGGEGKVKITVAGANLISGDPHSFLGKSIVIHTDRDQGAGDPSGKSGAPIACAVITDKHHD